MPRRSMEDQKLITEKTLQRYVYGILTSESKSKYRSLFPERFQEWAKKKIKVIIPECPITYGKDKKRHLADFRVVFDTNEYLNIEVEWLTSRFKHEEEVYKKAYRGEKGFLLVLENDRENIRKNQAFIEEENIAVLDAEDFSYWFLRKAKHIVDGTISNYLSNYESGAKKNWLVFLPAKGRNKGDSLSDYTLRGRKKGVWAFRYTGIPAHMKNILDIAAGDTVVFVYDFKYGTGTRGRQFRSHKDWSFTGLDVLRVKNGYYCDLHDDTFEPENWKKLSNDEKMKNKLYMHYFRFKYPPEKDKNEYFTSERHPITVCNDSSKLPGWLEFIEKLRWVSSARGAPAELSDEAMNALYTIIGDR